MLSFRRMADMEGSWRAVSCSGAEAMADALGKWQI